MGTSKDKIEQPPYTNRGVTGSEVFAAEPTKNGVLRDVGIDWLTCTTDSDKVGLAWFQMFQRWAVNPTDWRNRWYSGKRDDNLRWGASPHQGYVLIATGSFASVIFRQTVPTARKVTRIDLQVTVRLPVPNIGLAETLYSQNKDNKYRDYGLRQHSRGGQTLYVSSRFNAQFGRVYDKGVESKIETPGYLWRFEVELKKPTSDKAARGLLSGTTKELEQVTGQIEPFVYDWFNHRGVNPPWERGSGEGLVVEVGRKVTSDEKKLEWLKTQVKPTIWYLIGEGKSDLVMDALGLSQEQLQLFDKT